MPKQVDHAQRRLELADALWRLVMRDGIGAASLRRVAAEAGWSAGSLRHYFATHSELLAFAMELVTQRVGERVAALREDAAPLALISEILPLDAERRAEAQVWLAFTAQAVVDPALGEMRLAAHEALRGLCARARPDAPEALHAFVDGLALHAVLDPATTTPERQLELLGAYL